MPPVINPLEAPVLNLNEEEKTVSWDFVSGASNYLVSVDGREEVVFVNSYDLSRLSAGEHEIKVVAISDDTFEALNSEAAVISYTVEAPQPEKKKGCGGFTGAELPFALSLLGLGVVTIKRRR